MDVLVWHQLNYLVTRKKHMEDATIMKIREMPHFSEFIRVIFDFLQENRITSCVTAVSDYDSLMQRVLNSEVIEHVYNNSFNFFSFDIDLRPLNGKDEIYLFLFGKESRGLGSKLHVELGPNLSFMMVEIDDERYPPFVTDLLNERRELFAENSLGGEVVIVDTTQIMSVAELKDFLQVNNVCQDLIRIEVE